MYLYIVPIYVYEVFLKSVFALMCKKKKKSVCVEKLLFIFYSKSLKWSEIQGITKNKNLHCLEMYDLKK